MKVELVYNKEGKVAGYDMFPETEQDVNTINAVRDMHFWGLNDTAIEYAGRKAAENDDIIKLRWRQRKYSKPPDFIP